jgi:hypothetical protein
MALSFPAVEKAYKVFGELKSSHLPQLKISSFPEDASKWSDSKREDPPLNTVIGFDQKHDCGWENLFFFVKDPSEGLKQKFDELKTKVPNSSMAKPYNHNTSIWIFGWF